MIDYDEIQFFERKLTLRIIHFDVEHRLCSFCSSIFVDQIFFLRFRIESIVEICLRIDRFRYILNV